ncbi:hypothetical protein AB0F17_43255 [Nonomuraea sp. NPDC026600]|uniref:hypothetical protein n=1 Tax=Nonomuraea sp. NPDC026600 TaxID=3155363 RepID=UPI0033C7C4AF
MTTPDINERYVLAQDGMSMYYLASVTSNYNWRGDAATAYANGEPMTKLNVSGWWGTTSAGPHEIVVHIPNMDVTVRWDLKDPEAESASFPRTLTPEQFRQSSQDTDVMYAMYSAVQEPAEPTILPVDGPWTILEDALLPPQDKTLPPWTASLPNALKHRPEYRHLFPGYLSGLREHLADRIKRMPNVQYCFNQDQVLKVYIRVPLEMPEQKWVTPVTLNRRRKPKPELREIKAERSFHLPVPDRVQGASHADALKNWDKQVEFWLDVVRSASAKACNHCHGHGYVWDGAEEYAPAVK